jgi:hypothetical protein
MARLMEHSRRHGPFDPRYRPRRSKRQDALDQMPGGREIAGWEDEGGALRERRDAGRPPSAWS